MPWALPPHERHASCFLLLASCFLFLSHFHKEMSFSGLSSNGTGLIGSPSCSLCRCPARLPPLVADTLRLLLSRIIAASQDPSLPVHSLILIHTAVRQAGSAGAVFVSALRRYFTTASAPLLPLCHSFLFSHFPFLPFSAVVRIAAFRFVFVWYKIFFFSFSSSFFFLFYSFNSAQLGGCSADLSCPLSLSHLSYDPALVVFLSL